MWRGVTDIVAEAIGARGRVGSVGESSSDATLGRERARRPTLAISPTV
jgi:hypothetical protein